MLEKMEIIHFHNDNFQQSLPDFGDRRCIGYYNSYENALKAISICNLHRDEYEYCIIEEIPEGVYKDTPHRWLFKRDINKEYLPIKEPQIIANVRNFSIG